MKVLRCRDTGFDCDEEIRAQNETEVLSQAAKHARMEHGIQVTPEMTTQIRGFIHDETPPNEITPTT